MATGTVDPAEVSLTGSVPIQIENGDGTISNTSSILIVPPGPNLTSLDPGTFAVGTATSKVVLNGSDFDGTSKVFINGQLAVSTFKKKKGKVSIEAQVPAEMLTQVGQLTVQIKTDGVGESDILLL